MNNQDLIIVRFAARVLRTFTHKSVPLEVTRSAVGGFHAVH